MGTGTLASGASGMICTEIAFGGLEDRLSTLVVENDRSFSISHFGHTNIVVRTAVRTGRTPDAGQVVDPYDAGLCIAANRSRGATNHADGIDAMHTGISNHVGAMRMPMTNKAGIIVMRGSARPHAVVASRTSIEVDDHGILAVDESMLHEIFEQRRFYLGL